jgi:hypothetical protein
MYSMPLRRLAHLLNSRWREIKSEILRIEAGALYPNLLIGLRVVRMLWLYTDIKGILPASIGSQLWRACRCQGCVAPKACP